MKPIHTLIFLGTVMVLCLGLCLVFPEDGIAVTDDVTLKFVTKDELFGDGDSLLNVEPEYASAEELLEVYTIEVDSIAIKDSLKRIEAERRQALLKIQYKEDDKSSLHDLFEALEKVRKSGKLRVMHYGDSQIEGDRISGYIRNELQKEFGGTGPGLMQAYEVIPTMAIKQSDSENWSRKAVYGRKDTSIHHKDYGLLAHFSRYEADPEAPDSLADAWIEFSPSNITYSRAKRFNKAVMYYGNNEQEFELNTFFGDSLISSEMIAPMSSKGMKKVSFSEAPESLRFEFSGENGPDIYGVSFEGNRGVVLDNIPLRGSSGTIFKKIEKDQLKAQYADMDIELFILQFGGNTVPYIENVEGAERYGRWFKSQISYLKSIVPEASIIVIGPSDMAHKVKDKFVSRPFLEDVRDALKNAAFESGCGFWDIYEVMGGPNSMKTWVEADPALAGSDYTHFTPKGAKKIAELFMKAFWEEYEAWKGEG